MDFGTCSSFHPRLTTGFAAISVVALVMTPVAVGQPSAVATPTAPPAVKLAAVTLPLQAPRPSEAPTTPVPRLLTAPTTPALPQPSTSVQPLDVLAQQISFHVAFITDFLTTGAVLFAREFAIPGTLLQDIHSGVPVPTAAARALATFAQIELEAGGQLVNFAAQYVSFQLNFVANVVAMTISAVGEAAASLVAHPAPASATPTVATASGSETVSARRSARHDATSTSHSDDVTTPKGSATTSTVTQKPERFRSADPDSATGATKTRREHTSDASDQAGGHAAATRQGRSGVPRERSSDTGSSTSGGDRRVHAGSAGNQHQPKQRHERHSKDVDAERN